ncbi:hypothetical protein [Gemmobacter serpentinus]|uniref:hypothetical protein n=1 Tax=Gemmobacter serpentinus TaxID=2652247 RepID=UPI00124E57BE|nr:hypothetical protein [Gemmobacter serpentinus]
MLKLLMAVAAGQAAKSAADAAKRAALIAVAGFLGLIAMGFVVAAGFIVTLPHLGPAGTALAFGGGFLVLALIVLLIARPPRRRPGGLGYGLNPGMNVEAEAAAALGAVPNAIAKAPGTAMMAAFAGGLILALRLRK